MLIRERLGRRGLMAVLVPLIGVLLFSAVASAAENGPTTSNLIRDGYGASHHSTVYYTKQSVPFIAWVDRVYFGGRKPSINFISCCGEWRHENTLYRRWNDSSWVTVRNTGSASWQSSGTPGLSYFNLNTDVTLEGGVLVKQRLKYRKYLLQLETWIEWNGSFHSHFLE